jgi:hypothetical protein
MRRFVGYPAAAAGWLALLVAACLVGCADRVPTVDHEPTSSSGVAAVPPSGSPSPLPSSIASSPSVFVSEAGPVTAGDLGPSWRDGCPVGPAQLRLLRLSFWGFDDQPHTGTIVVHASVAADVIKVFGMLYAERFPIRSLRPVDAYGGSDDASMAADNTSGFNCRNAVTNGPPRLSVHAYGKAIDVNPVENPYLLGNRVLPPEGAGFVDRTRYRPGMAVPGGTLVKAFASVGWAWGGSDRSAPDYQHFSTTGG